MSGNPKPHLLSPGSVEGGERRVAEPLRRERLRRRVGLDRPAASQQRVRGVAVAVEVAVVLLAAPAPRLRRRLLLLRLLLLGGLLLLLRLALGICGRAEKKTTPTSDHRQPPPTQSHPTSTPRAAQGAPSQSSSSSSGHSPSPPCSSPPFPSRALARFSSLSALMPRRLAYVV